MIKYIFITYFSLIFNTLTNFLHILIKKKKKSKFKLIGLIGNKQCGKDTLANYLCKTYNYKRIAFADPIKDICKITFDFNDEQLNGNQKEVPDNKWFNLTPRKIFQFIGTDLFRKHMSLLHPKFNEDFWILIARKKIYELLNKKTCVVVSDVRFQNECDMIKELNGITIKIIRKTNLHDHHISENNILIADYVLTNNDDLDILFLKLDALIQ